MVFISIWSTIGYVWVFIYDWARLQFSSFDLFHSGAQVFLWKVTNNSLFCCNSRRKHTHIEKQKKEFEKKLRRNASQRKIYFLPVFHHLWCSASFSIEKILFMFSFFASFLSTLFLLLFTLSISFGGFHFFFAIHIKSSCSNLYTKRMRKENEKEQEMVEKS